MDEKSDLGLGRFSGRRVMPSHAATDHKRIPGVFHFHADHNEDDVFSASNL